MCSAATVRAAPTPFTDVEPASPHAANIGCLYGLGITKGSSPTTYEPSAKLTSAQMSRFLLRIWQKLGHPCDPAENELAQAGDCLTRLRVVPDAAEATSGVLASRAQMAVYLIGLWYRAAGHGTPPMPPVRPSDAATEEQCGLATVGDWYYETRENPEYGTAHAWYLPSTEVSWDRPEQGVGNDCWWDASLSLVCWEDGEWSYVVDWDELGQVERDSEGYTYIYMDPGDPDLAWEDWLSVEVVTAEEGDLAYISLLPDDAVEFDWTDYVDYAVAEEGELRVLFVDTDEWIIFSGASGWEDVFDACVEALPETSTLYSQPEACRPDGLNVGPRHNDVTAGFPLPSWAVPATGLLDVAVVFADFPDARAPYPTEREAEFGLAKMEQYLQTMSDGLLDVRVTPFHGWLTASNGWKEYLERLPTDDYGISRDIVRETALRAEKEFGLRGADYDSLMVVLPSSRLSGGLAGGKVHIDGAAGFTRWSLVNNQELSISPDLEEPYEWWPTAAHELVHNLGLADLYPYDRAVRDTPDPPANTHWIKFEVGLMGLEVNFPAPLDAYPYTVDWAPGYRDQTYYDRRIEAREMLAWSRWQLGWLDASRMVCLVDVDDVTVELSPLADRGTGVAMVAIPHHADDRLIIVAESRRSIGYDHPEQVSATDDAGIPYHYTEYGLPHEGVIVYLVRADRRSGELPLLLWTDDGNGEVDEAPVMRAGYRWWLGEPGSANGQYLIEILSSSDSSDTIRVTFTA